MRAQPRPLGVPILALTFALPFLLGADRCEPLMGNDLVARAIHYVVDLFEDLDERVSDVEACTCCCDGVLAPVCGEDQRTYVNACEAECAGIRPIARGQCGDEMCGGPTGHRCGQGEFCELPPGCEDPMAVGMCQGRPIACPEIYAPVCGCDGVTYSNDCERRAAGVSALHPGECRPEPIRCEGNGDCDRSQYCGRPEGRCDAELGKCTPRPQACPRIFDPVCGCDDVTYSNTCEAAHAGASIAHDGACEQPVCDRDADCPDGHFCDVEACGALDVSPAGVCVEQPGLCPLHWDPVCGCDGVTYGNECQRLGAGAWKRADGACDAEPPRCGGIAGLSCPSSDHVCIYPPNTCHIADRMGECVVRPGGCIQIYDPVCGCDGITYASTCTAVSVGASILHEGECEDAP